MAFNAGDRKDIRRLEKAARFTANQNKEVIKGIMSVAGSREWMFNLLGDCHVFATSFASDPSVTAFREGERNVGLRLLGDILASCPEEFILMMREANVRARADEQRNAKHEPGEHSTDPGDAPDPAAVYRELDEIYGRIEEPVE